MQLSIRIGTFGVLLLMGTNLWGQCINDECGDIFADWALLSEQVTICEGATFEVANQTLFSDIDFYVWDWGNGERDTVYEVANHFYTYIFDEATACAAGNDFIVYNISLEIYRFCDEGQSCHTQIAPVAIRFKPRANFSMPEILCAGDTIPITDMSCNGAEYLWVFGDGTTSTDPNPNHVYDSAGVYDVTLVLTNECGADSLTQTVEVLPRPVAVGGFSESSAESFAGCAPLFVEFTNASDFADDFNWVFPDEAGVIFLDTFNAQSPEPRVEFVNPGTYTVQLQANSACGTSEWEATIEVLGPPEVNLFPVPPVCDSATLALVDYLEYSGDIEEFQWTIVGPEAIDLPNAPDPVVDFTLPGSYSITLEATSTFCPGAMDSTVLLIQVPEDLSLENPVDGPLCEGSEALSLAATPVGGSWSGPGIDSTGLFSPGAAGVGTHLLHYTYDSGACILEDSVEVDVLASDPVMVNDALAICQDGTPVQLDFSPTGGTWTGPGIVDEVQGLFDPNVSGPGNHTLRYSVIDENQCVINQQTEVDVQSLPQLSAPDTSAFCIDQLTINLANELAPEFSPAGGAITWSGAGITDDTQGTFSSPGQEGIYTVQLTYAFDFCVTTETLWVSIIDPDEAVAGPDRTVCITDASTTLSGTPAGGRWSGPGLMDEFSGEVDLSDAGGGTHQYVYSLASGSACEVFDTVMLTVETFDQLDAGVNAAFCADVAQANLPTPTPAGGQWTGPGLNDPATGSLNIAQLQPDSSYWYRYSITSAASGCTFSDSVAVAVHPVPQVAFEVPEYSCASEELSFSTPAQNDVSYHWDFGNGQTANGASTAYAFTSPGTYAVSLTGTTPEGCSDEATETVNIATVPAAGFDMDGPEGCGPLSVQLSNTSTGTDLNYQWELGNGQSSTQASPPVTIYQAGIFDTTYLVRLTVGNTCGDRSQVDTVRVLAQPVANFGTQVDDGCAPLEVQFANTTLGNADSWYWDLGNGEVWTDSLPPNQFYATSDSAATTYLITLLAENSCGVDSIQREVLVEPSIVTPFFNVDTTAGCQPLTVVFTDFSTVGTNINWNFGDGTLGSGDQVSHTFDSAGLYTVYLYASNACTTDSISANIEVLPAPAARFEHPGTACPGDAVGFVNQSGPFQTILWDFGDGTTSSAISPTHEYDSAGIYTVTMTITNSAFECPATYASTLTVLPRPSVALAADAVSGCPPLSVCFAGETEGASFFEWDFGDGNSSTNLNPCHIFTETGQYKVQLRGADELGCMSVADSIDIVVFPEPEASFSVPDETYCGVPMEVAIANTSIGATAYDWNFGNGQASVLTSPELTYTETGTFDIELTASNTFGCTATATDPIVIHPQPLADFAPIHIDNCAPQEVVFDNASTNATSYTWSFGTGEMTSDPNPVLIYEEAGSYDVTLVVAYEDYCFDSLTLNGAVELLPRPFAAFDWGYPSTSYQGLIQFNNESMDAEEYVWDFGDGSRSSEEHPLHDYEVNGSWMAELVAIAANGCRDTALVDVVPEFMYSIYFPNAFSPETGEGDVRYFKPVGVGVSEWELEIFSPWSERIFFSNEINEDAPAVAWDGRYNGRILPQGAYAYKATVEFLNGVRKVYVGSVTLVR